MTKFVKILPWFLIAVLAFMLIAGTFHKALTTSFTHDESFTYNHYVTASLADIFSYRLVSPNNHLLNTLLMKTGAYLFGPSEIALRFPNILAHLGFMFFSLLVLRRLDPWIMLPLFAMINCNPYLLDFFALARGNGLSCFFLMGSIYFLVKYHESGRNSRYAWSVIFAFFSVLSHFTLLYFFLALIAAVNLLPLFQRFYSQVRVPFDKKTFFRINFFNLVASLILAIIMTGPVIKLVRADQLFYGGESGFWKDTVGTLIETFFYGMTYGSTWGIAVQLLVLATILATLAIFLYAIFKKNIRVFQENSVLWTIFVLLLLCMFIILSQFYLVGTKLPVRRYGLLFVPLFMLVFSFLIAALFRYRRTKTLSLFLGYGFALTLSIHTFSAFSATTYLDWVYEKETRHVVTILQNDVRIRHTTVPVTLGITWLFEPTVNFYRLTGGLSCLKEVNREGPGINADYYYISREEMTRIPLRGNPPVILFDDGKTLLVRVRGNN